MNSQRSFPYYEWTLFVTLFIDCGLYEVPFDKDKDEIKATSTNTSGVPFDILHETSSQGPQRIFVKRLVHMLLII